MTPADPTALSLRRATRAEREQLSELAFRSKAHWGYSAEFMEACRAELSVSPEQIGTGRVFVAEDASGIVGFYGLEPVSAQRIELTHCFVEPAALRNGVGRRLVEHARAEARRRGSTALLIQSDPQAAPFYARIGARPAGTRPSDSIPGRVLPLLELDVDAGGDGARDADQSPSSPSPGWSSGRRPSGQR